MTTVDHDAINLEVLVDALAELMPVKAKRLAGHLKSPHPIVREMLVDLEQRGIAYRTGRTRGTYWCLG